MIAYPAPGFQNPARKAAGFEAPQFEAAGFTAPAPFKVPAFNIPL